MRWGVPATGPIRRLSVIDLVVLIIVALHVWSEGTRAAATSAIRLGKPTLVPLATSDAASAAHLLGHSVVGLVGARSPEEPT